MFRFKQFSIDDTHCAHKVGTDGVLLGAWAEGGTHILDIGTGSGLIALMMAQRFPLARIDAVEKDPSAAQQAEENIARSPFKYVKVYGDTLEAFTSHTQASSYDSLVCNPPFFMDSLKNPDPLRTQARHTDSLPPDVLFSCAARLLCEGGKLSLIIPREVVEVFISKAQEHNVLLTQQLNVYTTPKKAAKRTLLVFQKCTSNCQFLPVIEEQILTLDGLKRSDWYQQLTRDFYL